MKTADIARKLFDAYSGRSVVDAQLMRFCEMITSGRQDEIYTAMRAEKSLNDRQKKEIIGAINEAHFIPRQLEWTNHGIMKTFRFWTADDKADYLKRSLEMIEALKAITPNVCFGFGAVLGMVRDEDFIPHDDDMDIIVGLQREPDSSFRKAKEQIRAVLEGAGYTVHGDNMSHYGVNRGAGTATDVFIGFIEDDGMVSWFPSRRGLHRASDIFPATTHRLFGVECPIPKETVKYIEKTYGADWREPIANWNHPWDSSQYKDFIE